MKNIEVTSKQRKYNIIIQNNLLKSVKDYLPNDKFYVIVSDDQIPQIYIDTVREQLKNNLLITFPSGEKSKSFTQYQRIISILQQHNINRSATIIALGGGVTGDLVGFVASTYLRGVDYVQIPTTLLSQIDSSVGGKVAINTDKAKNSIGSFYAPSIVLIDPLTLKTLTKRHFNNGMAEMIKYGMIYSASLFDEIINNDVTENMEHYIYESLMIKKHFVESDEFDKGVRQILNYGHTYGHAYESYYKFEKYLHGEAISLGMIKVCEDESVKSKLINVFKKYDLPISDNADDKVLKEYIKNDKKNIDDHLNLIVVETIGKASIKSVNIGGKP